MVADNEFTRNPPRPPKQKKWSLWLPERDPTVLAIIGKLGEEAGELAQVCGRIVAQGIDGHAPQRSEDPRYNGEANTLLLSYEIADVVAWGNKAINKFNLDRAMILERVARKGQTADGWINDLMSELIRGQR